MTGTFHAKQLTAEIVSPPTLDHQQSIVHQIYRSMCTPAQVLLRLCASLLQRPLQPSQWHPSMRGAWPCRASNSMPHQTAPAPACLQHGKSGLGGDHQRHCAAGWLSGVTANMHGQSTGNSLDSTATPGWFEAHPAGQVSSTCSIPSICLGLAMARNGNSSRGRQAQLCSEDDRLRSGRPAACRAWGS